jgi:nicotinate-nucleotide adenylyltransferase
MRVLVFGGSFNPPHMGHVLVVAWALWTDQADEVWALPTADHPFGKHLAPLDRRTSWLRAALAPLGDRVRVEPLEAELPRPSYTLRTLEEVERRRPGSEVRLVVGADLLAELPRWYQSDELIARFRPIVVGRVGYPRVDGVPSFPEVSSTEVRDRLGRGDDVTSLVPAAVLRAMTSEDLAFYRGPRAMTP